MIIVDMHNAGISMASRKVYRFIKLASAIAQDYYPEYLGKYNHFYLFLTCPYVLRMYIVNAPMLFSVIWAVVRPWLDKKTQSKITIVGSSYKKMLLKDVDIENLPPFLGGKCKCKEEYGVSNCFEADAGPWRNIWTDEQMYPEKYKAEAEAEAAAKAEAET